MPSKTFDACFWIPLIVSFPLWNSFWAIKGWNTRILHRAKNSTIFRLETSTNNSINWFLAKMNRQRVIHHNGQNEENVQNKFFFFKISTSGALKSRFMCIKCRFLEDCALIFQVRMAVCFRSLRAKKVCVKNFRIPSRSHGAATERVIYNKWFFIRCTNSIYLALIKFSEVFFWNKNLNFANWSSFVLVGNRHPLK